ncbi:SH3 domain-containing protein [Acidaminococcus fermentans]|uniref:SH3 domain-containing protein n=1 Tax=Acidaminococcus fermentans TaxID=905 RepID=UPI003F8C6801
MLKKTCAVLMSCLVLGATTVPVWTAEASVSVKTLSRTENKVKVECPQVSGGSRSADDKINRALSSQVASFVSEASTLGGGKVHYDVHRSDEDLVSFTLVMTPNMGVEESVGMTFDRKTGELRPLSYYYTKDQLAGLAQNGLQYLYDVDPAKLQTLPDTYYVDRDGSLIGVYHAGAVLDKSEGEIEINLSAAGMDEEGNVTEAPIDHGSSAPAETENASSQGTAVSGAAKPAETADGTGESTGQGLARIRARLAAKEKAQDEAKAKADAKARAKAEKAAKAKAEEQARLEAQAKAEAQARAEARARARAEAKARADEEARKEAAQAAKARKAEKKRAAEAAAGSLTVAKGVKAAGKTATAKPAVPETKPDGVKEQAPARPMTVKEKVAAIQAQEAREEAAREEARMKELVAIKEAAEKRAAEEKARREAEERAAEEARRQAEAEAEAERQAEAQRQAEAARAAAAALDTDVSGAGVITGSDVRMRDGAGLDSGVIGVFSQGESVEVLGSTRADGMTWYKVSRSDGSTGYVAADYCSLGNGDSSSSSTGTITGTDVRMRASYSTDSDVLGYFDNGETVTLLDDVTSGGQRWLKVQRSDGSVGWVSADFCVEN